MQDKALGWLDGEDEDEQAKNSVMGHGADNP